MQVKFYEPYIVSTGKRHSVVWPEGWPIPREGETVYPEEGTPLYVRHVCWYPNGSTDNGLAEPFVYVVLSEKRPS